MNRNLIVLAVTSLMLGSCGDGLMTEKQIESAVSQEISDFPCKTILSVSDYGFQSNVKLNENQILILEKLKQGKFSHDIYQFYVNYNNELINPFLFDDISEISKAGNNDIIEVKENGSEKRTFEFRGRVYENADVQKYSVYLKPDMKNAIVARHANTGYNNNEYISIRACVGKGTVDEVLNFTVPEKGENTIIAKIKWKTNFFDDDIRKKIISWLKSENIQAPDTEGITTSTFVKTNKGWILESLNREEKFLSPPYYLRD